MKNLAAFMTFFCLIPTAFANIDLSKNVLCVTDHGTPEGRFVLFTRFIDADGNSQTCFQTETSGGFYSCESIAKETIEKEKITLHYYRGGNSMETVIFNKKTSSAIRTNDDSSIPSLLYPHCKNLGSKSVKEITDFINQYN